MKKRKSDVRYYNLWMEKGYRLFSSDDMPEALKAFEKALKYDPHSPAAYYNIGLCSYYIGNYSSAIDAYREAAAYGYSDAMRLLGDMCMEGKGIDIDIASAKYWYRKAADLGDGAARFKLTEIQEMLSRENHATSENQEEVILPDENPATVDPALEHENTSFSTQPVEEKDFSQWMKEGNEALLSNDYEKALKTYQMAVSLNDLSLDAHYNLSLCYSHFRDMNNDALIKCYRQLADMCFNGVGTAKNIDTAVFWYKRAAKLGDVVSKQNLERLGISDEMKKMQDIPAPIEDKNKDSDNEIDSKENDEIKVDIQNACSEVSTYVDWYSVDRSVVEKYEEYALNGNPDALELIEDMVNPDLMACSQIILFNPILHENKVLKEIYLAQLENYISSAGWGGRKWVKSALEIYRNMLKDEVIHSVCEFEEIDYRWSLIVDIAAVIGYNPNLLLSIGMKKIISQMSDDLSLTQKEFVHQLVGALAGKEFCWKQATRSTLFSEIGRYVEYARKNILFIKEKPFKILVTATMSAGKSTFINALIGKNITMSKNLACTGKIHSIVSKTYEDNLVYNDDLQLNLNANDEILMRDDENDGTKRIGVATYYNGNLGGTRIILNDSPGINSSINKEHRVVTEEIIKNGAYDLLIYLVNATQVGIQDDAEHLDFINEHCSNKRILFLVNKIDSLNYDEENVFEQIESIRRYLENHGFKDPVIAPIAALAGVMVKKKQHQNLSRSLERQFYNFVDKFYHMGLVEYYQNKFPDIHVPDAENEEEQLLKTCGLKYVEKIIMNYYLGVM